MDNNNHTDQTNSDLSLEPGYRMPNVLRKAGHALGVCLKIVEVEVDPDEEPRSVQGDQRAQRSWLALHSATGRYVEGSMSWRTEADVWNFLDDLGSQAQLEGNQ